MWTFFISSMVGYAYIIWKTKGRIRTALAASLIVYFGLIAYNAPLLNLIKEDIPLHRVDKTSSVRTLIFNFRAKFYENLLLILYVFSIIVFLRNFCGIWGAASFCHSRESRNP